MDVTSQGYGGDVSSPDSIWKHLLCEPDIWSANDIFYESKHASGDSSVTVYIPAVQSECKLQPRGFSHCPSISLTYTPPRSSEVVELQCLPAPPPLGDMFASIILPPHTVVSDAAKSCSSLPAYVDLLPGVSYVPLQSLNADVGSPVMPCRQPAPDNFTFSPPHVVVKLQDQIPDDAPPDVFTLGASSAMELRLPMLEAPSSPIAFGASGIASPAYRQKTTFTMAPTSNSFIAGMSSVSAPAAANSSFYGASTSSERAMSLNRVPTSPTPSVNKGAKRRRSAHATDNRVDIKVKTRLSNLDDGYRWKKYGQKDIKNAKSPRNYFKCDKVEEYGCEVLKRTQMLEDEKHTLFTYYGIHNHLSKVL